MSKRMACECGFVVTGDSETEFIANARSHLEEAHPEVAGEVEDSELLAQAEDG